MKRFWIWIGVIVISLVCLDILFGYAFKVYKNNVGLRGDYVTSEMMLGNYDSDIAVLGSSVALNSINTRTLQDSLGQTAINGASNGQTFPFYLTTLKAVVEQRPPRRVILGLIPSNMTDSGLGGRYNFLAPYYGLGIADIDSCMESRGPMEPLFLRSNFYRLNTIWFRIMLYTFITPGLVGDNGFIAKPLPPRVAQREHVDDAALKNISTERLGQLREFISLCKLNDVELTIVMTPRCIEASAGYEDPVVREMSDLCRSNGVAFYDDTFMAPFADDETLFYDINHININGSVIYTDSIIQRLR